jgi:hypothetical protein
MACGGLDFIWLLKDRLHRRAVVNMVMNSGVL